jgi:D-glycero-D-manno-heptose 1,7-bisphosphate phosphatase
LSDAEFGAIADLWDAPVRLVLIDRDGTVNERRPGGYIDRTEDLRFLDTSLDAFRRLADVGLRSVIVTNQSGIGRGVVGPADVARVNAHVVSAIQEAGGSVEAVYCCPHAPADECRCRKPAPGLIQRALAERGVSPAEAVLIGDAASDVEAGRAAGVRTILVLTGRGEEDRATARPDAVANNLLAAVEFVLGARAARAVLNQRSE